MSDNIGIILDREDLEYNFASGAAAGGTVASGDDGIIKVEDRLLPIANVGRIMKQILPPNAKISKEAKETMQECVSEFISFVTGEASDKCHKEKRKTVNGDDICWAMAALGFDNYAEHLKRYLNRYREQEGERASLNKSSGNQEEKEERLNYRSAIQSTLLKLNGVERIDSALARPF
ncbi:Nuclear transcription factor Y subunit B-4 [Hibiscus syriacus]|uniref:Nuclear transcription factor Y subunit B-4 n=1 Tax=Hibiscus syriacus TaxID=106335 RepID=A0A6A2WUY2_HIBSY|nr:nuclear transcription factor Y subunit B-4-like [Hibiscus syriacus]KAE8664891.1 Nuclear transcription factor Y subunit B-4 [Hibiscus syriacus]